MACKEPEIDPLELDVEELTILTAPLLEISRKNHNLAHLKKCQNEFWELNDKIKGTLSSSHHSQNCDPSL